LLTRLQPEIKVEPPIKMEPLFNEFEYRECDFPTVATLQRCNLPTFGPLC